MNIFKLLGKLNQIAAIYFQLEVAEVEIRAAVPGEVVTAGTVKFRIWSRYIEIPLNIRVIE